VSDQFDFGGAVVWEPTPAAVAQAHLTHFMAQHDIPSFAALLERAAADVPWFTAAVLEYLDIRFSIPYQQVLDLSRGPAWPEWCVGGRLNITVSCLDKWTAGPRAAQPALIWEGEEGRAVTLSYAELQAEVARAANGLRALGLQAGDVVGLFMPMTPELVIALLATARLGGVALPLFSGYGVGAVVSRLQDAEAKFLFTADGTWRRGKPTAMLPVALEAAAQVPSLRHLIVLPRLGEPLTLPPGRDQHWQARLWADLLAGQPEVAAPADTAAEDLLLILYTSGTTGRPKGAVHTHCGFPIKAAQDMAFGLDVHPGDRPFWVTDMGWMMGPWLVFGALLLGATCVLYDGAPDYPDPGRLWALVERHRLTQVGVSPTLIRALIPAGEAPVRAHDLSSLRAFASTGEPWNPAPWMWLFETVGGRRIPIINYSGGTEISGGIVMGSPLLPLKPCAFAAPCPGMVADVVDEDGAPLRGAVGELVLRAPWIGMTRGFWRDPARYEETYWSRWPGIWVHGDFAAIDGDGMWYILGRSDDTLKIAGKRLGPAEVESLLVAHPAVVEAAAIAVPDERKGGAMVIFCVLVPTAAPSEALRAELRARVVAGLGKPLAPKAILFVPDLPRTRNAKLMRRTIRATYLGEAPGDTSALVNPAALDAIRQAGAA
jgi:acetyl-CoA synthetase